MAFTNVVRGAAAVALMAGLMGCAGDPEVTPEAVARASASDSVSDPSSAQYFKVQIGDTIFFTTDSSELTPSARAVLDKQAEWLRANPSVEVRLEGHADERGTREYNIALGARRANTVAAYLAGQGVDAARISVVSFGRERPLSSCATEECWAQNRRVQTLPR